MHAAAHGGYADVPTELERCHQTYQTYISACRYQAGKEKLRRL